MIKDSFILIRKPFSEQYTIVIDSEVNGVDVQVKSTVQLRYDFQVLKVDSDSLEIRLVQLDNVLVNANNPMVREVAQVSQIFGRMYNELHLLLDNKGDVIKVLNTELILSKWKQTKAEMEKHIMDNDDLKYAISLNDAIFTDPEKIKVAAQANEFLRAYFGQIFGVALPAKANFMGTNIFNTINMEWSLYMNSSVPLPAADNVSSLTVQTKAEPKSALNAQFYKDAYRQFESKIDISALKTSLYQDETRIIEYETGRVQEAEISKVEIADERRLYNKLRYTLKSDSGIIVKAEQKKQASPILDDEKPAATNFKFF